MGSFSAILFVTATHISYYHVCWRKLWLFANGIQMETTSDAVSEGKLIHETAYPQRAAKYEEIEIGGSKIDYYDPERRVVHEIKKSDKMEASHIAQVKYYLYLLYTHGIPDAMGLLEYPNLRETREVRLQDEDVQQVEAWLEDIRKISRQGQVPERIQKTFCRQCSYFDFCWGEEA